MQRKRRTWFDPEEADRVSINPSDGQRFFGFDDEDDGTTAWYDEDGNLDCILPTPRDYDIIPCSSFNASYRSL